MPQNPEPNPAPITPVLEVLDDIVPKDLHDAAWQAVQQPRWFFGHGSNTGGWSRFWKMDLEDESAYSQIWELARPRCEQLAGGRLEVIRVYANGHTYGLGGEAHRDDPRDGTFTLLYYPNPEWKDGWDGETVYYDEAGEVALAVRLRPNRAVFFDSRILHVGRAPSRQCTALRVTVAYKLQLASGDAPAPEPENKDITVREIRRNGARQLLAFHISAERIDQEVRLRLEEMGREVKLPGFRPGQIPMEVLEQRYGHKARESAARFLIGQAFDTLIPRSSVPGQMDLKSGQADGPIEIEVSVTQMGLLEVGDLNEIELEQLTASPADLEAAGLSPQTAELHFAQHLRTQILDHLNQSIPFPILPILIQGELDTILAAAKSSGAFPEAKEEQLSVTEQLRAVAERRLRLGYILAELGRRAGVKASTGPELERFVVDQLIDGARKRERTLSVNELRALAQE
ncbi:MAG: hypothetical protein JST93_33385 [Acidobacteria bacterium]|nr:hypothetical protein [Acidobacteriota bacterium]